MRQSLGSLVIIGIVLSLIATPVAAAVTLSTSTSYGGADADSQAITTTLAFSPNESNANDVTIDIDPTARSFIDYDSFTVTTDPGTEEVNVTYRGDGEFTVPEVEAGEQITIEFDIYPRTIKQRQLRVGTVSVQYVQNGQNLEETEAITADLSSSSYFALQNQRNWQLYAIGLGVAFIIALVAAVYLFAKLGEDDDEDDGPGTGRRSR